MTPSTISSFIPSKSITLGFESSSESSIPGEGGGVCSYLRSRFGGGDIDGDSTRDLFTRLVGCMSSDVAEGGEGRAAAR